MNRLHPVDNACSLQVQLIAAMRRVRAACPRWWNEDRVQQAMHEDLQCFTLAFEVDEAWQKAGVTS